MCRGSPSRGVNPRRTTARKFGSKIASFSEGMADMPEMSRAVRARTQNTIPWAPANSCRATFRSEVTLEKPDQ
eukprot:27869-Amphidinium_carterae.1